MRLRLVSAALAFLLAAPALAGDDDFNFDEPPPPKKPAVKLVDDDPLEIVVGEDSGGFDDPNGPQRIRLETAGKAPLGDHYPLEVIAVSKGMAVVQIPVLLAAAPAPNGPALTLIAEGSVGGKRLGEVRQIVGPESYAAIGPSFAFLTLALPVSEAMGEIAVAVKRAAPDGSAPAPLFTRRVAYATP